MNPEELKRALEERKKEIRKQRSKVKKENRAVTRSLFSEYKVRLDIPVKTMQRPNCFTRVDILNFFRQQWIKTISTDGRNGDVFWNKQWSIFYFKKKEHAVLFKLKFGGK